MKAIPSAKSRLQFRRDVCQALYSPRGKKRRYYDVVRCFETWWDAHRGARGAAR